MILKNYISVLETYGITHYRVKKRLSDLIGFSKESNKIYVTIINAKIGGYKDTARTLQTIFDEDGKYVRHQFIEEEDYQTLLVEEIASGYDVYIYDGDSNFTHSPSYDERLFNAFIRGQKKYFDSDGSNITTQLCDRLNINEEDR